MPASFRCLNLYKKITPDSHALPYFSLQKEAKRYKIKDILIRVYYENEFFICDSVAKQERDFHETDCIDRRGNGRSCDTESGAAPAS